MPKKMGQPRPPPKKNQNSKFDLNQFYTKFDQIQYATFFQPQLEDSEQ